MIGEPSPSGTWQSLTLMVSMEASGSADIRVSDAAREALEVPARFLMRPDDFSKALEDSNGAGPHDIKALEHKV